MFFAPFLFIYGVLFFLIWFAALLFAAIGHAFRIIGLPPDIAFIILIAALFGSYFNIPVYRIRSNPIRQQTVIYNFGMRYRIPLFLTNKPRSTLITVNIGGTGTFDGIFLTGILAALLS